MNPQIKLAQGQQQNEILKYDHTFNTQFTKTGQRPQNFIKNVDPALRYSKYPRLAQLIQQKNTWIKKRNHPPIYLKADLETFQIEKLGKFDVILIDPPWEQYEKKAKRINKYEQKPQMYKSWGMNKLTKLKITDIAQTPSFIFLWVGGEHLEDGRELMKTWNYKRCEDIVWVKTNNLRRNNPTQSQQGIFVRVKEHCLMGYKGEPKKASSHNLIHPNIDIDVVVTEEPEIGSLEKPHEIYDIIQRFCLGRKRIELFGNTNNIRNGWLTVGNTLTQSNFNPNEYNTWFKEDLQKPQGFLGGRYMGTNPTIESLRPREDTPTQQPQLLHQNSNSNQKLAEDDGKRSLAKSDTSRT